MTTTTHPAPLQDILNRITEAENADRAHDAAHAIWVAAKARVEDIDEQIAALRDEKYEATNALDAAWRALNGAPASAVPVEELRAELAATAGAVDDCPACRAGGIRPPHTASPACQSGGRDHCSCEVCF